MLFAKVASQNWKNLARPWMKLMPKIAIFPAIFKEYKTCRNIATVTPVSLFRDLTFHEMELDGQEKLHEGTEENC